MVKVSVIVPVYNVEKYLTECIDSIVKQTFEDLEIILVDDGSTDTSGNLCDDWAKRDPRIKVLHKKNGGLSSARNAGLDVAKGQYISFVDSDDKIDKNFIKFLFNDIKDTNSDIACCNYYSFDLNGRFKQGKSFQKRIVLTSIEGKEKLLMENYYKCYAWNKLYKYELFNNIRYPVGKLFEDIDTTYELFNKSNQISYRSTPLYYYRQRDNSITASSFTNKTYDLWNAIMYIEKREIKNSNIMLGCLIYKLYFLNSMIRGGKISPKILNTVRLNIENNLSSIIKTDQISLKRKVQFILLYKAPKIYIKFLNSL